MFEAPSSGSKPPPLPLVKLVVFKLSLVAYTCHLGTGVEKWEGRKFKVSSREQVCYQPKHLEIVSQKPIIKMKKINSNNIAITKSHHLPWLWPCFPPREQALCSCFSDAVCG